jgi:hypothetical protein
MWINYLIMYLQKQKLEGQKNKAEVLLNGIGRKRKIIVMQASCLRPIYKFKYTTAYHFDPSPNLSN